MNGESKIQVTAAVTLLRDGVTFTDATYLRIQEGENYGILAPGGMGSHLNSATYIGVRFQQMNVVGPKAEWMEGLVTVTIDEMLVIRHRPIAFFAGGADEYGTTLINTPGQVFYDFREMENRRQFTMWGLHVRCQKRDVISAV